MAGMKESDKAAALYRFGVTPTLYRDLVSKDQTERPTNKRKSTRYTWLTFFPIAFGLQFKKLVNIFYILTGILNMFRTIQVNSPIVVLVPTFLIMLIGVAKEFVSELQRWRDDKKINATPVKRLAMAGSPNFKAGSTELVFENVTLADVKGGDIIRVDDMEQVPADCILLRVEDQKPEAFVKTAALDGERNLKPKLANELLSAGLDHLIGPKADTSKMNLSVNCIVPQKELYYFEGRLKACLPDEPEFKMNLDLNQFLHRGSFIENSGHVVAMVVYTGTDTKLILNLGQYVFKMSSFEKILNYIYVINLCMALLIGFITAGFAVQFRKDNEDTAQYIFEDFDTGPEYIVGFFRAYLIVNSFVPLDLLAMLEISKVIFTPIMQNDVEMMIKDLDLRDVVGFKANTLNLPEELAQVDYIFCDKTGTLTQNELVFRAMTL